VPEVVIYGEWWAGRGAGGLGWQAHGGSLLQQDMEGVFGGGLGTGQVRVGGSAPRRSKLVDFLKTPV